MVHFTEINQDPPHYPMSQYIGESSNTKSCAKKLSEILGNNNDNEGAGLVPEFMRDIADHKRRKNLAGQRHV